MLDRLTRLAAKVCQAPVALMTVIEAERQFFVSQVGLAKDWAAMQETPLPRALWHPLDTLGQSLIVSGETGACLSHESLPLMVALGMAACLKVPLKTSQGESLGYLCVMNPDSQIWSDANLEDLVDIAAIASREIEQVTAGQAGYPFANQDPYLNDLAQTNAVLEQTLSALKLNLSQLSAKIDYRTLVEQVPAMIYINALGNNGSTLYISPQVQEILGYAPDGCTVDVQFWSHVIHPDDQAWVAQMRVQADLTKQPFQQEYRMVRKDGETIWVRDEAVLVNDRTGMPKCWQGVIYDITARRSLETQLAYQATHDALTGLANRPYFVSCLEDALQISASPGNQLAVLFLDLDDFKAINDNLGHRAGDQVLIEVGTRLGNCLAAETAQIARLGGDEFVVLLKTVSSLDSLRGVVQRVLDSFEMPVIWQGQQLPINVSIGAALNTAEQSGVDQLLQNADIAMYQAKRSGKGCYHLFRADMEMSLV